MATQAGFLLKVLLISALLSVLIKDGGPMLALAETPTNVLIAVLLPTLILAIALLWRSLKQRHLD